MAILIEKAVRYAAKLRMALYGPSGSGKTYLALLLAMALAEQSGKRVCVIDTEKKSASKYADLFPGFDFDVINLTNYHPNGYIEAIKAVARTGEHAVLILDSISHEWDGAGGALELVGKDFTNWAKVTPLHNAFVDEMLKVDLHVIATMRAKEEYSMEKEDGKKAVIRKVGVEPIQRKGIQYEFDVVGSLEIDNSLTIEKSRCSTLSGKTFVKPGREVADALIPWLDGLPAPEQVPSLSDSYKRGLETGAWTKENFYAAASTALSIPVARNTTLSSEQLKRLAEEAEKGLVTV